MKTTTLRMTLGTLASLACLLPPPGLCGVLTVDNLNVYEKAAFYGKVEVTTNRPSALPVNGLCLYYNFDTNQGSIVTDQSGNGHTGAVSGATFTTNAARGGGAYYFDGTNDYISVRGLSGLNTPFTICAWVKGPFPPANNGVLMGSGSDWGVVINDWPVRLALTKIGWSQVAGNTPITDDAWHHAAVSYNGSYAYFYLDGAPDGIRAYAQSFSLGDKCVGNRNDHTNPFKGTIDEMLAYNRVLSDEEVQRIYSLEWPVTPDAGLLVVDRIVTSNSIG